MTETTEHKHYGEVFEGETIPQGHDHAEWFYRVKAGNGEIVDQSEGYATKWNAERALVVNNPGVIYNEEFTKDT